MTSEVTFPPQLPLARYDGFADWHDEHLTDFTARGTPLLVELLGAGRAAAWRKGEEMSDPQDTDSFLAANRRHWNELVDINARSDFYDVESFKRGRSSLREFEVQEIGEVTGKSLLHLQCHFGMDTLSWARLGAVATGVDFSDNAIALARSLSAELGIPAEFICADIYDLPRLLDRSFDVVFTSFGVICWLPDLRPWGSVIRRFLRPGGTFYIADAHPLAGIFSDRPDAEGLEIENPYFHHEQPARDDEDGAYSDRNAKLTNRVTYDWQHSLSDVINALAEAGLRIEFLHEYQVCAWQRLPIMSRGEDRWWRLPEPLRDKVPLMFSLKATAT